MLHEDLCIFVIRSCRIVLGMVNISTRVVETPKTRFCVQYFFIPEKRAVCEIVWKNMVQQGRLHIRI